MISPLQESESLQDTYRRLTVDCIAKAIAALDEPQGRDVAIHSVRKQCKQARALVRLFHDGPPPARREACQLFRDLGRALSEARDARVAVDVHALLLDRYGALLDPTVCATVRSALERALESKRGATGEPPLGGEELRRQLLEARVRARRVVTSADEAALKVAFVRAYRRARRAARDAADGKQPTDFHEARKRAKDYWYQLEIVARRWPAVASPRVAQARRLTELLGDGQDCEVYAAAVEGRGVQCDAPTKELLVALAQHRAQSLRQEALQLCSAVFVEKPKELAAAIDQPEPIEPLHRAAG